MKDALVLVGWFGLLLALGAGLDYFRARRRGGRVRPRPPVPLRPIPIICGNLECSGEGLIPRQTLLARDGACDECGSRSYILASDRARRPVAQPLPRVVARIDERPRRERRKKYA